jgi:hypothetical protein
MPRKIESWTHLVIDEAQDLALSLIGYSEREVVIITCSMIDSLLADLLTTGLRNHEKEIEMFLGLDGDGRAPLGSFGSRIQAAYLLKLIDDADLKIYRILKDIRNRFAHHVVVSFGDATIVAKIRVLTEFVRDRGPRDVKPKREYLSKEKFSQALAEYNYSKDACIGYYVGVAAMQIKRLHEAYADRTKAAGHGRKEKRKKGKRG